MVTASASADDVKVSDKARAHFNAGLNLMQDPGGARYREALRQFKAAYAESPSWKILGNLGISAMKVERDGEAIDAFRKYLAEGGTQLTDQERSQAQTDLQTLETSVVYVTLEFDPPVQYILDERLEGSRVAVANEYEGTGKVTLGIRAGRHRITAKLAGYKDSVWEFPARSGSKESHVFKMEKPTADPGPDPDPDPAPGPGSGPGPDPDPGTTEMERPVPLGVFVGLAATGAFAVGGVVTGLLASSKRSEFDDKNDGTDPTAAEDLQSSGQTLNLVADVLFGGALIAGGITAILYLNRPEVPAERDTASIRVEPRFGPNLGGVWLTGAF